MVSPERIQEVANFIAQQFQPDKIILFGSYAYGNPTEDSDVDLLVLMDFAGKSLKKSVEIEEALDVRFPLDLIVRTSGQVQERIARKDVFLREIVDKGQTLYDCRNAKMGGQGRG